MMRTLLLLVCFCTSNEIIGQNKKFPPAKPEKTNFTKYALPERLLLYPFSNASGVKLVSFSYQMDTSKNRLSEPEYGLPMLNDTICFQKLDQIRSITVSQVDTLTDILYNTCFRWTIYESNRAMCYLPHNAIIFYDKEDKVFEYIEICFDCHQLKFSSSRIKKFEACDFTYTDLRKFFKSLGFKTSIEDFERPGR